MTRACGVGKKSDSATTFVPLQGVIGTCRGTNVVSVVCCGSLLSGRRTAKGWTVQPLITLRKACKNYAGVQALKEVDFDLQVGEIHGLVGHNGAGKSTLIAAISGITSLDSGELAFQENIVRHNSPAISRRCGLYVVYQSSFLQPNLTVAENLFVNRWPKGRLGTIDWAAMQKQGQAILQRFGIELDPRRLVKDLNLAQQKMLEIVQAISSDARILILDEPTAALTLNEIKLLFEFLRSLRSHGVGIIYVTHHLQEIFTLCDRVTIMRNGERVDTRPISDLSMDTLTELMMGGPVFNQAKRHAVHSDLVLEVRNVRNARLQNISFQLRQGEILGLAGLNGSGRSELLRALCGLDPAEIGYMRIGNMERRIGSYSESITAGMAYLPENRNMEGIIPQRSIRENYSLSSLHRMSNRVGMLHTMREKQDVQQAVKLLRIKLRNVEDPITSLSGGNQQKVVLGKLLATKAKVLLLDEPTSGIDIGAKSQIFQTMDDYAEAGGSIVFVSPELHELLLICDRILILQDGQLVHELADVDGVTEERLFDLISEQRPA